MRIPEVGFPHEVSPLDGDLVFSSELSHFTLMSYQDRKKEKKRMRKQDHHEGDSPHEENQLQESTPEVEDPIQHICVQSVGTPMYYYVLLCT